MDQIFSVLEDRERLIVGLAVVTGMRPGEIFGLRWEHVSADRVLVCQRVYRGEIDSPKTHRSAREVAISNGLSQQLAEWRSHFPDANRNAWVFPSERGTPLSRDNFLRRCIKPRLKTVGLEWVNFQVMRRTHASLMRDFGVDPKVVADQLGHTLDVNLNVYTKSDIESRRKAVNLLESMLCRRESSGTVTRVS